MNHDQTRRELCPAYLKACGKCGKLSHFAAKCRSKKNAGNCDNNARKFVRAVDDDSEPEVFYAAIMNYC